MVNIFGPIHVTQAFHPLLRAVEHPAIERPDHAGMGAMVQYIARKHR